MNQTSSDRIRILFPELPCRIGILAGENAQPQPVVVSLELELDLDPAARSGRVGDTVDYSRLHRRALESVTTVRWGLVEELAGRLVELALTEEKVEAVTVVVRKCRPPLGDAAGPVEIEMRRRRCE